MTPPPVIKIGPPPTSGASTSIGRQVQAMFAKHGPNWNKQGYTQFVLKWASVYKVDPRYLASLLLTENPSGNPSVINPKGAVGLAQIVDQSVNPSTNPDAIWDGPAVLTTQWKQNPNNAIKYAAWRLAGEINQYGSLDNAYSQGYNPGYRGAPPSRFLPKGVAVTSGPGTQATPAEGAGVSVAGTQARHALTDPWVVVTSKGVLKTVKAATAPQNTVRDATGAPYTLSQFTQVRNGLDSIYMAYTGQRASANAVAQYIKNPVSDYQIQQQLSNPSLNPRFYKSPIWLTHAPSYESVYKGIYGNDANVNSKQARQIITYGVTHNLDQTAFQQYLRDQPNYSSSEEYKGNAAQFRAGYESIYGTPDAAGEQNIDLAVRKGWNGDQWMQYLRSQPEYTASGEFQQNVYNLFSKLGFIKGAPTQATGLASTNFGPMAPTPAPNPAATGSALVNG